MTSTAGPSNALDLNGQGPALGGQCRLAIQPQGLVSMGRMHPPGKRDLAYLMCPGLPVPAWGGGTPRGQDTPRVHKYFAMQLKAMAIVACRRDRNQW